MVANFLGDTQVGRVVAGCPIGIHGVGIVAAYHQLRQVVVERGIVVFGPDELLGKRYQLRRVVPCSVVFGIECQILVFAGSVVGRAKVVAGLL